jgi:dolichol-phosphate mannosyltransferase
MTVIIPAYKPDEKLLCLLDQLKEYPLSRIIVVNDGSGKEYETVFQAVEEKGCTLLTHPQNRGKGAALKTAFSYLASLGEDKEICCTADADGQHLPADIFRCLQAARQNPGKLILGSRNFKGDHVPARSLIGNTLTRWSFHIMMGKRVFDTQTGLRAFSADLLPSLLSVKGDRYEYEMEMLCYFARKKLPILEIEIETVYLDDNRSSHFNAFRDARRVYGILLRNACGKIIQVIEFLFSSLLAFFVDLAVYYVLFNFLLPSFLTQTDHLAFASLLVARTVSSVVNYTVNRDLVFHNADNKWKTFLAYSLLVVAVFFANHWINTFFLVQCGLHEVSSLILAQVLCFIPNFCTQKFWIFPNRKSKKS